MREDKIAPTNAPPGVIPLISPLRVSGSISILNSVMICWIGKIEK